jgi:hypothetical protein
MFRHRRMTPEDVGECVEIVAAHPVIGPRYGKRIGDLCPAWLRLAGSEAMRTAVLEDARAPRARICFVGVAVCVEDRFICELKTRPLYWFGPELANRVARGDSPVLSDRQVREANSSGGLNLVCWEGCLHPEYERYPGIHRDQMRAFIEEHSGFFWKEAIANQCESVERMEWTLNAGGLLWNPAEGRYVRGIPDDPAQVVAAPHVIGITREIEFNRPGSWAGALFRYNPPRCCFSRRERQLLLLALAEAATDQALSECMGISLPTIKKMWLSVYRRAAPRLPELIPDLQDVWKDGRGKEKKRHLLAYVREHPEELRPVSRKLLRENRFL